MGREIRRVPPDWEHPRQECKHSPWSGGCSEAKKHGGRCLQPLHDESYRSAAQRWKDEFAAWERGERPDYFEADGYPADLQYWEYNQDPPDRKYYRPDWPEGSATHYQAYETVSEGTPVTPHFATQDELIDHLVAYGDDWDHHRGGWDRAAAEQFVRQAWAPSMIIANGVIYSPRDGNPLADKI
jgi:hypothetical protein